MATKRFRRSRNKRNQRKNRNKTRIQYGGALSANTIRLITEQYINTNTNPTSSMIRQFMLDNNITEPQYEIIQYILLKLGVRSLTPQPLPPRPPPPPPPPSSGIVIPPVGSAGYGNFMQDMMMRR